MAQGLSNILRNFVCFVDGYGKVGDGHKCTLPKLTDKVEEYLGGGMHTPIEVPLASEKLEAEFSLTAFDPQTIRNAHLAPGLEKSFSFRGALIDHAPGQGTIAKPVVARMLARIKETDFGEWEVGNKSELKFSLSVYRYRITHDDKELVYVDCMNGVWRVFGQDQQGDIRGALGV